LKRAAGLQTGEAWIFIGLGVVWQKMGDLAKAAGKPLWTLVQFAPDWRWFVQFGERTP